MQTVLITGGTGLIGSALTEVLLARGYKVIILTRRKKPGNGSLHYAEWDPLHGTIDENSIQQADYIIHLAGANVAEGRWTKKRKMEIIDSRVKSGELLVRSLKEIKNNVKAIISSSAIGIYGPDPRIPNQAPFTENDKPDNAFLAKVCQLWEAAIKPVTTLGKRLVIFRTGIVLSNKGGAYGEFKKPMNFGIAAVLGGGKQIVSWIHIDDIVKLYIAAIENEKLQGIYNAVAPNPVSNKELITAMAKQKGKFYIPVPVPAFALKVALGEMSIEVLKSATVSSQKIENSGYEFLYPSIEKAIKQLTQ